MSDNSIEAISNANYSDDLVHLDTNLKELKRIPKIVSTTLDETTIDTNSLQLAVDGLGNVYIFDYFPSVYAILKFDANGKYINRFGAQGHATDQFDGTERFIAIDNQSRVYVPSSKGILIFDSKGRFIDFIAGSYFASSVSINDNNEIFTIGIYSKIYKIALNA